MDLTYAAIICLVGFIVFYLWSSSRVKSTPSKTPAPVFKKKSHTKNNRDNEALTRRILRRFNNDS